MKKSYISIRKHRDNSYIAAIIVGFAGLLWLCIPTQEILHAKGPLNTGHTDLACQDCHLPALGSTRQQIQANVRYYLNLRSAPVDFGHKDVDSNTCLDCHDRPNDRHSIFRFAEPRFAKQRESIQPHQCISCHKEHKGQRVTLQDPGFCQHCHQETALKNDPINVPHSELIAKENWESCLGCHDFHGNHIMKTETMVEKAHSVKKIINYFEGGKTPYPTAVYYKSTSKGTE